MTQFFNNTVPLMITEGAAGDLERATNDKLDMFFRSRRVKIKTQFKKNGHY